MNSYFFARWWCKLIYFKLWLFFRLHSLKYHKSWVAKIFWVYQLNLNWITLISIKFFSRNWIFIPFEKFIFEYCPLGDCKLKLKWEFFITKSHHPVVSAICLSKPIQGTLVPKLTIWSIINVINVRNGPSVSFGTYIH